MVSIGYIHLPFSPCPRMVAEHSC